MRVTTYAYPWDLANLGVEATLKGMADEGFEAVELASTYHPIDSFSPRGGARLYTSARGAVFFPTRPERYGRIRPVEGEADVCAAWPQAARAASKLGLGLNAWTITLFQPWIRDAYPDTARVFPGGDPSGSGICPANEDVREFFANLCADAVDQFSVGMVRLENLTPHTYDLDWMRPRVLFAVPPLARTLLTLCFCGACERQASAKGIDVQRLRGTVNGAIAEEITEGPGAPASAERTARLAADAELAAYAMLNVEGSIRLIRTVAARVKPAKISSAAASPFGAIVGAKAEQSLREQFAGAVDQLVFQPGADEANQRLAEIVARTPDPPSIAMLMSHIQDPEQLDKALRRAAGMGAGEVGLYNYGIMQAKDAAAFAAAARRLAA